MRSQNNRRLHRIPNSLQAFFYSRNNSFGKPIDIVLTYSFHSFTQSDQQPNIWIFFDECCNRFSRIIGNYWSNYPVSCLGFQPVMVCKRLWEQYVIEHLNNPYPAPISFRG